MLWIAKKEALRLYRRGGLPLAAALFLLAGIASGVLSWIDHQHRLETARTGNRVARVHWLEQEAKNPHSAAHFGVFVFREPEPGAWFDPGVLPYAGQTVFIEAHHKNNAAAQPIRERGLPARFGDFSPAFFLTVIAPLFIILLFHGAVAGERESQTLRAVAVTGISPRSWLAGKWLVIWAPILLMLFIGLSSLFLTRGGGLSPTVILLVALGYLLFLGGVLNLTLMVSCRVQTRSAAIFILVSVWIFGTLVLPRLAVDVAEHMIPTPLIQNLKNTVEAQKQAGLEQRVAQVKAESLADYDVEKVEDLPVNFNALSMQTDEELADEINDQLYADLYANQRHQTNLYRAFSILWPLLPTRFLSMTAAAGHTRDHHRFNQQAEHYRRHFVKLLNHDMMMHSRTGDWSYQATAATWAKIPDFNPEPRDSATLLQDMAPDIAILLAWFLLSGLLLFGPVGSLFRSAS